MPDTEEQQQQQQHDDNNNDGHGRQKETTETAATASLLADGNKANVNDAKDAAEPRTPRDQTRTTMAASTSTQLAVPTTPATMPVTGGKFKDAPPELVIQLLRDGIIAEPEYDTMPLAVLVNTNEGQAGHPKAQAPQRTRVDLVGPHFARPMKHHHNPWKPPASEEDAVPGLLSVLTPAVVFGHRGRRNAWSRRHPENDKPSKIVASRYCEGQFLDARHVRDEDHDVEAHGVYEGTYYELLNSLQALLAYLQGLADVPPLLEPPEPPEIAELVLPPYKPPPAEQDPPDIEAPEFDEPEFMPPDGEPMPKMPDAGLLDLPADPGPRPAAYRPAAFKAPARERIKAYVEPDGEAVPAKPALVEEPQEEEEPDIEGVPEIGPAPEHPGDAPADATQPEYVEPEMPERPSEPVEDAPDTKSEVSEDEPVPPHVMEPKPMLQFIPEHLAVRPQPVCELCGDPGHTAPFCPRGKEPCARCGRPYQSEKCTVCGEFGHIAEFCPVDRCARCGEFGHKAHECPDKMRCGRCGEKGHTADVCPRMTCTRCGKEGHRAKFCPRDRCIVCGEYEPKPEPCELCGDMGHTAANCPHGKPIPCTLCGKMGHTAPFCSDAVCQLCGEPGHTADVCPTLRCGRCGDTGHKTEDCPRIHTQFPIYHKADAPLHLNWNPPFEEAPPKYPEPPEIPPPPFDGIPPGAPPERRNPDDLEVEPPFVEPSGEYDAGPKPEEPTLLEPNYPDVGAEPTYQEEPDFVAPIDDDLPEFVPPTEPRPIGYIAAEGRWWGYAPCMIFDHSGTMRFRKEGEPKSRFEDLRECQEMIFAHAPPLLGQLHASCAAFDAIVFTHGSWSFAYDAAGLASRAAKDRALYERHKGGERLPRGAGATWSGYSSTSGRGKGKSAISKLVHGTGNTQYTRRGTGSLPSGALIASADGVGSEAVVSKRPLTPSTQGVGTEPLVEERSYLRHSSTTLDLEQRNSSGNIWPEMRPGTAPSKLRAGHRVVDKPTGSKHPMLNFSWESHKNPPVECTPMMLDAAKQWLFRWPNARGASNMLGALIKGLESAPEAIYLFSDGLADSRRKVIELVEEYMAIGRCPPIHVIGFQCNAMGENLLRTLADMSGGSFQHYERQVDWMTRTGNDLGPTDLAEQRWVDEMMGFEMAKAKETGTNPDPVEWKRRLQERHHRERVQPVIRRNEIRKEQAKLEYDAQIATIRRQNATLKEAYEKGIAEGRQAAEAEVRDANQKLMKKYNAELREWKARQEALDVQRDRAIASARAEYDAQMKEIRARNQVKLDAADAEFAEAMAAYKKEQAEYDEKLRKHKEDYEERLRERREKLALEQRERYEAEQKRREEEREERERQIAAAAAAAEAEEKAMAEERAKAEAEERAKAEAKAKAMADGKAAAVHEQTPSVSESTPAKLTPRSMGRMSTMQLTNAEPDIQGESDRLVPSPERLDEIREANKEVLYDWRDSARSHDEAILARNQERAERRKQHEIEMEPMLAKMRMGRMSEQEYEEMCEGIRANARAEHEAKCEDVRLANERQRAVHDKKLEEYAEAKRKYDDASHRRERELKRVREEWEAASQMRMERHAKALEEARKANEELLRSWEESCKEVEERNAELKAARYAEWLEIKSVVDAKNAEKEKEARAIYDAEESVSRANADALLREWESKMAEVNRAIKENERREEAAKKEHEKLIAKAEERNEARRDRAKAEHDAMVKRLKDEVQSEYNQMVAHREEMIRALRQSHEDRCVRAEKMHAEHLKRLEAAHEAEVEAQRAAYAARVKEVEAINEARLPAVKRSEFAQIEMWRVSQFLKRIRERAGTCLERVVEPITINTALDRAWPEGREHIPWSRHLAKEWPKPILKASPLTTMKRMEKEDDVRAIVASANRPKTIRYHNISARPRQQRPDTAGSGQAPTPSVVGAPAPIDEEEIVIPPSSFEPRPRSTGPRADSNALERPHTAAAEFGRPKSARDRPLSGRRVIQSRDGEGAARTRPLSAFGRSAAQLADRPASSGPVRPLSPTLTSRMGASSGRPLSAGGRAQGRPARHAATLAYQSPVYRADTQRTSYAPGPPAVAGIQRVAGEHRAQPLTGTPLSSRSVTPDLQAAPTGRSSSRVGNASRTGSAQAQKKKGWSVHRSGKSRWFVDETAYESIDMVEVWDPTDI